jgi:hypothetical protein
MSTSSPRTGCSSMPLGTDSMVGPRSAASASSTGPTARPVRLHDHLPAECPRIETDPMTGRRTSDDAGARVHDDPSLNSGKDVRSSHDLRWSRHQADGYAERQESRNCKTTSSISRDGSGRGPS